MPIPILRTKLHRPPVPPDIVCRESLHERLDAGRHLPLTLVSAPAGYGKSTLISHWIEKGDILGAWLSLDETDSDPAVFLSYFAAAVRTLFPDACENVLGLLGLNELPGLSSVLGILSNDLDTIEKPFILVLDDYYRLKDSDVHDLIDGILQHPPRSLHLVIISRRNPPLALASLRAHHMMTETRIKHLQFDKSNTLDFFKRTVDFKMDDTIVTHLHKTTEGWPVGIRLA